MKQEKQEIIDMLTWIDFDKAISCNEIANNISNQTRIEIAKRCFDVAQQYNKQELSKILRKAGEWLPTGKEWEIFYDNIDSQTQDESFETYEWMHSKASLVIAAKENEISELKKSKKQVTNLLMRKISDANDLVLDREKEIERLNSRIAYYITKTDQLLNENEKLSYAETDKDNFISEKDKHIQELREDVLGFTEWIRKEVYLIQAEKWVQLWKSDTAYTTEQLYTKYKDSKKQ